MTDTLIPHILALDTAQEDCGAAILLADGSLFMHVEHVGSRHSERLLPMVRDAFMKPVLKNGLGLIAVASREALPDCASPAARHRDSPGRLKFRWRKSPTWKRWLNGFERLIRRLLVREPACGFKRLTRMPRELCRDVGRVPASC